MQTFYSPVDVGELELVAVDAEDDGGAVQDAVFVVTLLFFAARTKKYAFVRKRFFRK